MRGSILHKETFQARNTDTSTYVDDMMLNEQTLQLDESLVSLGLRTLGKFRTFLANPNTVKAGKNTFKLGLGGGALGAIGLGGKKAFELIDKIGQSAGDLFDPDTWVGTAMTIGVGATASLAMYNLFKNWMKNKEETKRAKELARQTMSQR